MGSKVGTNGTNRRTQAKSSEKRQRILDAAARALTENGYSEAKLADIAREAGTQAGSLYYYFPSRDDLMKEVLLTAVDRMSGLTDPRDDKNEQLSPLERVIHLVHAAIDQLTSMRNDYYLRAYLRHYDQVPDSIRTGLKARRRQLRRSLTSLMQEAQAAGQISASIDINIAAQFIIGATNWMGLWYEPAGPTSADRITQTFLELVLHGLLGTPASTIPASDKP